MRVFCGGVYLSSQVIGFGAPTVTSDTSTTPKAGHTPSNNNADLADDLHRDQLLRDVESRDLMGYGMIPEFVGRFPVLVSLDTLDRDALVRILTEPRDALVPQFKYLFKIDEVSGVLALDPSPPFPCVTFMTPDHSFSSSHDPMTPDRSLSFPSP